MIRRTGWIIGLMLAAAGRAEEPAVQKGSLLIAVDRQQSQQAESAANSLTRGEISQALPLLERLWLDAAGRHLGDDGLLETVRDRVLRLVSQVPDEQRQLFWQRIEAGAGNAAEDILRGSPTRIGLRDLWRTAAAFRDHGEWELAAAAFDQAARHSAATRQEALLARLHFLDVQLQLSAPGAALQWRDQADATLLQTRITFRGETSTVREWLARRLALIGPQEPLRPVPVDRPSMTADWRHAVQSPAELLSGLRRAGDDLRAEGVQPLTAIPPLIAGERVVVRTPTGLDCRNLATGELLWTLTDRVSGERAALAAQQQNPLFRHKYLAGVVQRLQANSRYGAMSHDESLVYRLVEVEGAKEPQPLPAPVYTALEAIELATGQPRWRIGGIKKNQVAWWRPLDWTSSMTTATDTTCKAAPALSLSGPPLVMGNRLYFLCESVAELHCLSVRKDTLEVDWALEVGRYLPQEGPALRRSFLGCSPVWTGSLLVCPTASGAIAAIDPVGRTVKWIAQYPVEDRARTPAETSFADLAAARAALQSWRGVDVLTQPGRVIVSTPESAGVHVLESATGRTVCTIPRGNGLKLLGLSNNRLLVLEPAAIRAHDIATGRMSWRTVIGEMHGLGVVTEQQVVQPLAAGNLAVLDTDTGRRLPVAISSENAWGHLVPVARGWICADEFQVGRFSDVAEFRGRLKADHKQSEDADVPRSVENRRVLAARLAYEAGDFDAAREQLQNADGDVVRRLRRDVELAELRFFPAHRHDLEPDLRTFSSSREETAEMLACLAEAASDQQDWEAVVRLCLEGLELGVNGERRVSGEAVRVVRWDRVFSGMISAAWQLAAADQRAQLERQLTEHWQAVRNAGDPFGLQQLYQRLRGLDWTRREFLADADAVSLGSRLLSQELSLREAAESGALAAWWTLRETWRTAGFPSDADDIEHQLLQRHPGGLLNGQQTVRQRLTADGADLAGLHQRLAVGPRDLWPSTPPRISETKDIFDDAKQIAIPIEADPDSLWARVDVTIDSQARQLRFTGDGRPGAWTVALPRQSFPLPWMDRGWGVGRLLILRIGSRLLAVTPFDEHGAAVANVLWTLDLRDGEQLQAQGIFGVRVSSRWKRAADQEMKFLDQFGREFGHVGPVRAGYLCYQQQGKLASVETLTGRLLWERWDVPPGVIAIGDDRHVFLWNLDGRTVETLDAVDGRTIQHAQVDFSAADVWHRSEGTLFTGTVGPELTLRGVSLANQRAVWEKSFPQNSLPIALDQQTAAVIDPRGVLHFFDLTSGAPRGESLTVELPAVVDRVILSRDEARWYLGISGPSPRSLDWQLAQPQNGLRRPQLNGPLIAIRRADLQIAWKRTHDGEPWVLDQNQSVPVLTQIYKTPPPNGQGIGEGVLRLIDKRTGQDVFTYRDLGLLPNFSIEPYLELQRFTLRTERIEFQFDYDPEANVESSEAESADFK